MQFKDRRREYHACITDRHRYHLDRTQDTDTDNRASLQDTGRAFFSAVFDIFLDNSHGTDLLYHVRRDVAGCKKYTKPCLRAGMKLAISNELSDLY